MPVVNLTPHEVRFVDEQARVIRSWRKAPDPARVEAVRTPLNPVEGLPLLAERRSRAVLPEPREGVWYIVSSVVSSAHPERDDLLVPSDFVRDDRGMVTGCRSFVLTSPKGRPPAREPEKALT